MGGLEFIASIVKSCSWPAVLAFGLYLFRREIRPLLPYARLHLKHNDTEVDLRLDMARKTAEQLPHSESLPPPTKEENDRFAEIASISPRAAVLEAWLEVEEALIALAEAADIEVQPNRSPPSLVRLLRQKEVIDPPTVSVFDDLRAVRNRVVHDPGFKLNVREALGFRDLAEQCVVALTVERERVHRQRDERV